MLDTTRLSPAAGAGGENCTELDSSAIQKRGERGGGRDGQYREEQIRYGGDRNNDYDDGDTDDGGGGDGGNSNYNYDGDDGDDNIKT